MPAPHSALAEEWLRLKAALLAEHPDLRDDVEALADILDGETAALDVVEKLILQSREHKEFAAANSYLAMDYTERAERQAARADQKRTLAMRLMEAIGEKTIRRASFTASIVPGQRRVIVTDESALPAQFVKETVTRRPDKDAIKEALKEGQPVPGAVLSNGEPHLRVL